MLNFDYALVDVKGYDDDSVQDFSSRLLKVMMMFEKSENMAELLDVIKRYESDIERFNDEEARIISMAVDILSSLYGADEAGGFYEKLKAKSAEGVGGMLSNLIANEKKREQEWLRQGMQEGMQEGRQVGMQEGRQAGMQEGRQKEKIETAERLLRMGLTVEQAAEGSRLPIADIERIKQALGQM